MVGRRLRSGADRLQSGENGCAERDCSPGRSCPILSGGLRPPRSVERLSAVSARTFFHDRDGRPWASARAFRHAFNKLRDELEQEYGSFVTRYYVGLIAGEPLAVPTSKLTMRTMRHTCVTLNFDAGVPPNLIAGITGHRQDEIDEILAHYRARTADQAAAALELRLAHEAKKGGAA